jgi:hypothetical protein
MGLGFALHGAGVNLRAYEQTFMPSGSAECWRSRCVGERLPGAKTGFDLRGAASGLSDDAGR